MVLPKGVHHINNDVWEVGTFNRGGQESAYSMPYWQKTYFRHNSNITPKLFLTIQTNNDSEPVIIRVNDLNSRSFTTGLFEQESNWRAGGANYTPQYRGHAVEIIGYLAIFSDTKNTIKTIKTKNPFPLSYKIGDVTIPKNDNGISQKDGIIIQEDTSRDTEQVHADNLVHYLDIINSRFVTNVDRRGLDTFALRLDRARTRTRSSTDILSVDYWNVLLDIGIDLKWELNIPISIQGHEAIAAVDKLSDMRIDGDNILPNSTLNITLWQKVLAAAQININITNGIWRNRPGYADGVNTLHDELSYAIALLPEDGQLPNYTNEYNSTYNTFRRDKDLVDWLNKIKSIYKSNRGYWSTIHKIRNFSELILFLNEAGEGIDEMLKNPIYGGNGALTIAMYYAEGLDDKTKAALMEWTASPEKFTAMPIFPDSIEQLGGDFSEPSIQDAIRERYTLIDSVPLDKTTMNGLIEFRGFNVVGGNAAMNQIELALNKLAIRSPRTIDILRKYKDLHNSPLVINNVQYSENEYGAISYTMKDGTNVIYSQFIHNGQLGITFNGYIQYLSVSDSLAYSWHPMTLERVVIHETLHASERIQRGWLFGDNSLPTSVIPKAVPKLANEQMITNTTNSLLPELPRRYWYPAAYKKPIGITREQEKAKQQKVLAMVNTKWGFDRPSIPLLQYADNLPDLKIYINLGGGSSLTILPDLGFGNLITDFNYDFSSAYTFSNFYSGLQDLGNRRSRTLTPELLTALRAIMSSDDHGNTIVSASQINSNSTTDGKFEKSGDVDFFKFVLSSKKDVIIYSDSSIDTYGYLYSSNGSQITQDDDSGPGYNFRINRTLNAGTYYIKTRHYSNRYTGSYRLRVSATTPIAKSSKDDHSNSFTGATYISSSGLKVGTINSVGDVDFFRFYLSSRKNINIYTTGSTDTYGYLYNQHGSQISDNDDSGPGYNFKFVKTLNPGWYYVKVRHYSRRRTGSYSLNVRRD